MGAGEAWKKRREEMGMTLDEAAAALRISRKYLRGIDEGDYSGWPERVFSAGFIRAYAKLLSEDPEPVLTEYYRYLEQRDSGEPPLQVKPEWLERERQRGSRRTTYSLAAVFVLLVGMALAWYNMRTASRPIPAPEVRMPPPPVTAPAENAAKPAVGGAADNTAAQPAEVPAPVTPAQENAAVPSSQGQVASVGGVGPVNSPYQLFIEASELTWLMYSLDDGDPVDVMLYPGDKISIQARKKVFLKLGNAGGVVGTLNGKLLPPFGARGQVKEFRLGD
ncbi:MAG: DUF4115 domain-containing protein [Deltaproteobacteria bacterium]|nr:DUF4115 domain-containing protein [Deltaproteobacteria bacterium]